MNVYVSNKTHIREERKHRWEIPKVDSTHPSVSKVNLIFCVFSALNQVFKHFMAFCEHVYLSSLQMKRACMYEAGGMRPQWSGHTSSSLCGSHWTLTGPSLTNNGGQWPPIFLMATRFSHQHTSTFQLSEWALDMFKCLLHDFRAENQR